MIQARLYKIVDEVPSQNEKVRILYSTMMLGEIIQYKCRMSNVECRIPSIAL